MVSYLQSRSQSHPTTIVQDPDSALTAKEKNELEFDVLSDANQEVIKAYNLQFDPGEDYHNRRDVFRQAEISFCTSLTYY
jgi:hypothetical protein